MTRRGKTRRGRAATCLPSEKGGAGVLVRCEEALAGQMVGEGQHGGLYAPYSRDEDITRTRMFNVSSHPRKEQLKGSG